LSLMKQSATISGSVEKRRPIRLRVQNNVSPTMEFLL
jgi:hypothetical protein